ncbi:nicotinamide-nucleotide amidohydrolase family protein, partial [Microbacteriaceae bacterium K1510]|nr:nicotinamide-nucleotide amidohydrolase family protein [Microbacteriaceae bacterium K1510]
MLIHELAQRGETIACAESCTGGSLSALLTSVPGSSAALRGSIICYSNEAKHSLLDVPEQVLATDGAVSETT